MNIVKNIAQTPAPRPEPRRPTPQLSRWTRRTRPRLVTFNWSAVAATPSQR